MLKHSFNTRILERYFEWCNCIKLLWYSLKRKKTFQPSCITTVLQTTSCITTVLVSNCCIASTRRFFTNNKTKIIQTSLHRGDIHRPQGPENERRNVPFLKGHAFSREYFWTNFLDFQGITLSFQGSNFNFQQKKVWRKHSSKLTSFSQLVLLSRCFSEISPGGICDRSLEVGKLTM